MKKKSWPVNYAEVSTSPVLENIDENSVDKDEASSIRTPVAQPTDADVIKPLAVISETDINMNSPGSEHSSKAEQNPCLFKQYPPSVYFILGNEFCERFSFYGMRAILTMYLIDEYQLTGATAKTIYHTFVGIAFMSPLLGSVLADDHFGRFKVILVVSVAYVMGHMSLTVAGMPSLHMAWRTSLDILGLLVIALATGGIKPCVSAFAADQFKSGQAREREQFFSFFYFSINAGALLSVLSTPVLRQLPCLGSQDCYPLAFGVPGLLMLLALFLFVAGIPFYKRHPPNHSMLMWHSVCCVCSAVQSRLVGGKLQTATHWTDYAGDEYDKKLRNGVRSLSNILLLFCPVIVFWALFDQQGSSWVLQARCMDNRVGDVHIAPDQMSAWNAIFILVLVPLLEIVVYPLISYCYKLTPLRKMGFGCLFALASFIVAAALQLKIDRTMPERVVGSQTHFEIFNQAHNRIYIEGILLKDRLHHGTENKEGKVQFTTNSSYLSEMRTGPTMSYCKGEKKHANIAVFVNPTPNHAKCLITAHESKKIGHARFRILSLSPVKYDGVITSEPVKCDIHDGSTGDWYCTDFMSQRPPVNVALDHSTSNSSWVTVDNPAPGALYLLINTNLDPVGNNTNLILHTIIEPNDVSILWQVPQSFLITVAEVLISITGLEFSYSQAAPHMKSVVQAVWLMTISCGNLLAGVVAAVALTEPVSELILYAAMMLVVMLLFLLLAHQYQPVDHQEDELYNRDLQTGDNVKLKPEDTNNTLITEL